MSKDKVTPKNYKDFPGCRKASKARSTGRIVTVWDGEAQGMDTEGGRWQTVCEEHDSICCHETLSLAISHSSEPEGWCEPCQEELAAKEAQPPTESLAALLRF